MKALIIGGGIGGLCAGIALQQIGHEVTIFEQAPEIRPVGAGISLWANALAALKSLGIYDALREVSVEGTGSMIRAANGNLLSGSSIDALRAKIGVQELLRIFHRADLHQVLWSHIDPASLHTGAACREFSTEGSKVAAHFADGSSVAGDYLIGADGIHSVIRTQMHGAEPPTYAGYTAWRAVINYEHHALLPGETWGYGARFGHFPLTDERVYWYATHNEPVGLAVAKGEKARLLKIFAQWHKPITALIAATDEQAILRHDIYDRPPLKQWGQGRVTLLGDAAHPMTPNLGQGACQAIEDAVVLARCITGNLDIAQALRMYEQQRIKRTTALISQSRRIGRLGQLQNPLLVRMRNAFMKRIPARIQSNQLAQALRF